MLRITLIIGLFLPVMIFAQEAKSQDQKGRPVKVQINGTDSIYIVQLPPVRVQGNWSPRQRKKHARRYAKLIRDVKKAYPFAKLAGRKLKHYEAELAAIESERERKKFMKRVEDELRAEYEGDLRKLTITQGVILIKLVDRETGDTSYELVKQFRGAFSAFFWQSVARLFGHNLKLDYDAYGEDRMIEEVVMLIEAGKV